jgi:beta-lactamase superfamily II metal-dependent hydrolase
MRRVLSLLMVVLALSMARPLAQTAQKTLDIYYVDTEGGQATLFVSPSGQTVLVDTGNSGTRDPERIMEAVKAAGAKQIDYLVMTHYHGDHIGGYLELAKLVPIMHFVDHGPTVQPEQNTASKQAYDAAIAKGPYVTAKPGDKVPVTGIEWLIVSAAGKTLKANIAGAPGAGKANPYCADFKPKDIQSDLENGQSTGSLITYGKFRTLDLGDLLWNVEFDLMCPTNHIGTVDLFLVSHHGVDWSNSTALVHALQPRVAILNNGTRKGAQVAVYETLESSPGLEDLWQLHWSFNGGTEHNVPSRFIANVEDAATTAAIVTNPLPVATQPLGPPAARRGGPPGAAGAAPGAGAPAGAQGGAAAPGGGGGRGGAGAGGPQLGNPAHTPAYWLKVSAQSDGTFTVFNPRNGFSKTYKPRS